MGEQIGVVRIRGTVGNLTFTKDNRVNLKSGIDGDVLRTDKRFKRTRENWAEFTRAAKAAKLIRKAFALHTSDYRDRRGFPRLVTHVLKVVKSDPTSPRGQKNILLGDMDYLLNYDFNINQTMYNAYKPDFNLAIDRAAGTVDIALPSFIAENGLTYPYGATHFKNVSVCATINWLENTFELSFVETPLMLIDEAGVAAQNLAPSFTAGTTDTILVSLGVWFYKEDNGVSYQLKDGSSHAMAIVGIDHV